MEKAHALWRAFQDCVLARAAGLLLIGCTLLAVLEIFRRYVMGNPVFLAVTVTLRWV